MMISWVNSYFLARQAKHRAAAEEHRNANLEFLQPHEPLIQASKLPYVEVTTHKYANLAPWHSKLGGLPCLPNGFDYPKNSEGEHLHLLAQIDLEQAPALPCFPASGLLQFYISDQDTFGCNSDNTVQQDDFRVLYFPKTPRKDIMTDFNFLSKPKHSPIKNGDSHRLSFSPGAMPITMSDYRFQEVFSLDNSAMAETFTERYGEIYGMEDGHRMGGYPSFSQTDPRGDNDELQSKDVLLLQIDSDNANGIMWGDAGVANFFISQDDLKKHDFSKVIFTWDCC